jgi:prepilin-type N-terminal cleavage/methylation domain-containing protein
VKSSFRAWRARHRRGFTLIEMMAVALIILLMVGLTMPTFIRTYRSEILRSEARALMAMAQQARYQAIVHQRPIVMNLNFDEQAYWIEASAAIITNLTMQVFLNSTNSLAIGSNVVWDTEDLSTNAAFATMPTWTRRELSADVRLEQLQTLDDLVEASGTATITFYPNGASHGGLIVLAGSSGALGVQVDPLTSLPRLILDATPR